MAMDLPTPAEMVEAVAKYLRDELVPELSGFHAFQTLVAANMLGIAQRELDDYPQAAENELESLKELLETDGTLEALNRELCRRIRAGEIAFNDKALLAHLWETTIVKVGIDQPRYATYRRVMEERSR